MKHLGLVLIFMLFLLAIPLSGRNASAITVPTEFQGSSPPIVPTIGWSLGVAPIVPLNPGDIIRWHWTATGNYTFTLIYTTTSGYQTVRVPGLQEDDGFVVGVNGWYELNWYNYGGSTLNVTVNYVVDVFTPRLAVTSFSEGAYLNSHTVNVQGTTEGFATGVLVGTDEAHLQKASLAAGHWTATLTLPEGRNTVISRAYYWLQPLGAANHSYAMTTNVTVDTAPPVISIASPPNGTSIRGRAVQVLWNCTDAIGVSKVDMRIDGGSWVTVEWGDSLGLGRTPIGLSTGTHVIEMRGIDRAGNYADTSVTVRTNSDDWSLAGPMYGLPATGIVLAAIILSLVAYYSFVRPRNVIEPPPAPVEPAPTPIAPAPTPAEPAPAPVEPLLPQPSSEPKSPGQP